MMNFGAPMGNMGPMRPMMDGPMGPMGPMGMGGPMGPRGPMGPGGPMGRPMLDESMLGERGEPPIRVMGELYHEEDIVEQFDDALGNGERRIIDFLDYEAPCMRTLYVGNVPTTLSETHIREYFETFGTLETTDLTSRKRLDLSFFRIVAQEASTIDKIQQSKPHFIEGKPVTTKRGLLQKDKRVGYINTNMIYVGPPFSFSFKSMTGGLTMNTHEDELFDFFSKFGHVTEVKKDEENFGGAFITFGDQDGADNVALLRGFIVNGRTVEAEKVFNEEDKDEENAPDLNVTGDPEHKIMRKMIVFNLPDKTNTSEVKEYFSKFGDIEECFLPKSKGNGRIFAVLVFAQSSTVDEVMSNQTHEFESNGNTRKLDCKRPQARGEDKDLANADQIKFFARQAWEEISEEDIVDYFKDFGDIETIKILQKPSNRMGFVRFAEQDSARKASLLYLHKIKGRDVEVQKALDSRQYAKKRHMAQMHDAMMEEEMFRRHMIMENMNMMRIRAQREMGWNGSGLRGIGGERGMGADIPPVREGRGFGGPGMSPNVIILENVPGDMQKKDLLAHFSKFGHVRDIEYEKKSETTYILYEEDYMTDYCARKTEHTVNGVTLAIKKGKRPPRVLLMEAENEGSARSKRTAEEMEEDEEKENSNDNPLIDDEEY